MALTADQISKYALKRVEGGSLDDGVVTVGDQSYQVQGFERQQKKGIDTDQGETFGTSLEADAKEAGKSFSNFNTINDIQGALNVIADQKKEEPKNLDQDVQYSPELASAKAYTDAYQDFSEQGKLTLLKFGSEDEQAGARQAFKDGYAANVKAYLKPNPQSQRNRNMTVAMDQMNAAGAELASGTSLLAQNVIKDREDEKTNLGY